MKRSRVIGQEGKGEGVKGKASPFPITLFPVYLFL